MKFLLDMGIAPSVGAHLRSSGHSAVHLQDQGWHALSDTEVLDNARDSGSVLLTHDLGFGDLLAARRSSLPSVIIFRLRDMRAENVKSYLDRVLASTEAVLIQGAVVSVSEALLRIRPLPVEK